MRTALALLFFPCLVFGQGLPGAEPVILRVDGDTRNERAFHFPF